jgi:hypothetical protein
MKGRMRRGMIIGRPNKRNRKGIQEKRRKEINVGKVQNKGTGKE